MLGESIQVSGVFNHYSWVWAGIIFYQVLTHFVTLQY